MPQVPQRRATAHEVGFSHMFHEGTIFTFIDVAVDCAPLNSVEPLMYLNISELLVLEIMSPTRPFGALGLGVVVSETGGTFSGVVCVCAPAGPRNI